MSSSVFRISDDFPPVDYDQWRELVEKDLRGAPFEKKLVTHTYEGIDLQPIYTLRDAPQGEDPNHYPGLPPYVRGAESLGGSASGLENRQEYALPDLEEANQAILDDLTGGVDAILLRLDSAACSGRDGDQAEFDTAAGPGGLMAYSVDDLDVALGGVHLDMIRVALDAGAAFLPAAAALAGLWRRRGVAANESQGVFGADPLAALAREGQLPYSIDAGMEQVADLARWASSEFPQATAVGVDTSPYHHAGATAAQDLAFGLATGAEYMRAMTRAGMSAGDATRQIELRISLGTHHFLAIAKLRAARRVWWRMLDACGVSDQRTPRIHATTSQRVLTRRDPNVNLLRNSVAVFSACVGGADSVASTPYDAISGRPSGLGRRVARNTLAVLQEESHLHRVIDPAGGSWYLDTITEQLAGEAWKVFQEVEKQGGMAKVLQSGWVADQIDTAFRPRAADIARRKEPIIGVSEFPNLQEEELPSPSPDVTALQDRATRRLESTRKSGGSDQSAITDADSKATAGLQAMLDGGTIGAVSTALGFHQAQTRCEPIEPRSFAEPFEELRDATDAWQQSHGRRPRVFLANLGPIAHHTARATYSKNFFEAGGFEVITNDGFREGDEAAAEFAKSGAPIAVICSSDKLYPELVPATAAALKSAGARTIVLAGNPGDNEAAWREAGVDRFIFIKCDVLSTLRELLQEEGVLTP